MAAPNQNDLASLDAQDQVNGIINEDRSKNRVAVHTFDPEAPPQEKGAAAGKARDQVKSVNQDQNGHGAKGLSLSIASHFHSMT